MTGVLAVRGLSRSFGGVRAVADVTLDVHAGELVALIGPNGAGKTTCFNLINGQLAPDAGAIELDGRSIVGLTPARISRRGVGRTFQITATFASMTVRENVQTSLSAHHGGLADPWRRAAALYRDEAEALLALVGMVEQADRPCAVLAYGDLKRVELAMALANQPRLLLMDEPTAGMAPEERAQLMHLAATVARQRAIAVLFTEHDLEIVFGHADRVIVLDRGAVLADGLPLDVRRDARVRAVYLGEETADA